MKFESLFLLSFLSISMGFGSFFAGMVPLWVKIDRDKLDLVSSFGAGILIGAVFLVIIPEGIESVNSEFGDMPEPVKAVASSGGQFTKISSEPSKRHQTRQDKQSQSSAQLPKHTEKSIGISLLCGFVFMFLVDKFTHTQERQSIPISVSELRDLDYHYGQSSSHSIGLIIHALADGVALGSAFISGKF
jgi:zinc transporter 9